MMEERDIQMEDPFAFLTLNFLKKSEIFPGSIGHLPLPVPADREGERRLDPGLGL